MSFAIETVEFSKLRRLQNGIVVGQPVGKGYSVRKNPPQDWHAIVHTTNGPHRPSSFRGEATFIRDSPSVGAEYCVGKGGEITQIVDPDLYYAWQSGVCIPEFSNPFSLGIECQNSALYTESKKLIWEEEWTTAQWGALTWLFRYHLIPKYHIKREHIETHRAVARPAGRKPDPSGVTDAQFYRWRNNLYLPEEGPIPSQPSGTFPVAPRFLTQWNASGGIWQPDRLTPGFALSEEFTYNSLVHQRFERAVARSNPDGTISWLLLSEIGAIP